MPAATATGTALAAFFHLCVPAVSDGELQQTFPQNFVVPLTPDEEKKYTDAPAGSDEFMRIESSLGFILLDVKPPFCRIVTEDDDPGFAKAEFLKELKEAGGTATSTLTPAPNAETTSALIPLQGARNVAISFTISLDKDARGFFASSFLVEKTH